MLKGKKQQLPVQCEGMPHYLDSVAFVSYRDRGGMKTWFVSRPDEVEAVPVVCPQSPLYRNSTGELRRAMYYPFGNYTTDL